MASKWMLVVLILCVLSLEIQATKSSGKKASDSSSTKPEIKTQRTSRLDLAPSESRSEFLKSDNNKFANHQLDEYELKHRRNHIKGSMLHAWNGYKKYAGFAHDELRPITKTHYDWMNMSVSLFSSLDTLYIMNLTKEFQEAREWIRTNTTHFFHRDLNVSLFETTIRVLGGLLGAYQVSHDQLFVDKAEELAGVLLYAFENPSCKALPCPSINLKTHKGYATWGSHVTTLAEIGSLQLEFNYLSYLLNDTTYKNAADSVIRHLDKLDPPMGLYPLLYELRSGNIAASVGNAVTIGASADSFYEYLLKQWIQSNHTSHDVKKLYEESIDGILGILPRRSHPSEDLYIGYVVDKELVPKMDHLSCFFPGLLALGAHGSTEKRDLDFAEELLQTCFDMYACQFTGLAPEVVEFAKGVDFRAVDAHYYLRPETVESIFILHRKTGNPKYREWGWFIYQKLLQWCKTDAGFTGVIDVRNGTEKDDRMQAFFLSETLKYLYLLMCDDDILPLSKFVFNTEAHPMPILHYR